MIRPRKPGECRQLPRLSGATAVLPVIEPPSRLDSPSKPPKSPSPTGPRTELQYGFTAKILAGGPAADHCHRSCIPINRLRPSIYDGDVLRNKSHDEY